MNFSKVIAGGLIVAGFGMFPLGAGAFSMQKETTVQIAIGANQFDLAGARRLAPSMAVGSSGANVERPVQLAQANDAAFRINQLEEEMRVLNGKVEDMTFQLLQLQEQIRKMQEDNEFRFQELEKRGDAGSGENKVANSGGESLGKSEPSDQPAQSSGSDGDLKDKSITELLDGKEGDVDQNKLGEPPISLGTLTFDGNGNLVDSNIGKPIDLTGKQPTVDLPQDPEQLFDLGYQYVQAGEYQQAEEVYQRYVVDFPGSKREPEAKFWLGESLFSQGKYEEAAKVFLENHKQNPNAALGAQNLLKLGVSLAGLDQRELACATYAEVPKKYPTMSNSVRKRVEVEQRAAKCKNS